MSESTPWLAKTSQVTVRSFQKEDSDAVRAVFKEGMMSLVPYAFKKMAWALKTPIFGFGLLTGAILFLVLFLVGKLKGYGVVYALATFCFTVSAELVCMRCYLEHKFAEHVQRMLQGDLNDLWNHYMTDPMKHFWVATKSMANGSEEIVGCIGLDVAERKSENKAEKSVQENKDKAKAALEKDGVSVQKTGELRRMAVKRNIRRCGVATKLYAALEKKALDLKLDNLYLETASVNAESCAMYEKEGFDLSSSFEVPVVPWKYFAQVRYYNKKL